MTAPARTAPARTAVDGRGLLARLREDDLGAAPVVGVLVLIGIVLQLLDDTFLASDNLVNLTLQSSASGVLALAVVLVLMVGQIDLSVGAVSGLGSAVVAVSFMRLDAPLVVTVFAAVVLGAGFGLVYGLLSTRLGLPSFVLTLAGLLVAFGLQLRVLGSTGSVSMPLESWLVRFSQQMFLPQPVAYLLVTATVVAYAASRVVERTRRARADLPVASWPSVAVRVALLAVVLVGSVAHLGTDRGLSAMFTSFVVLVAVTDLVLRRTRWGRTVRAIGGDVESARRAGLPVRRVTVSVFVACSSLAAVGGVLAVGRLAAANQGSGGTEASLTAIAAAVIGGVSLFGGRGSAWAALLGILVIQSISSGLTLMNLGVDVYYMVTGVVLVLAITIDTAARRNRSNAMRGGW